GLAEGRHLRGGLRAAVDDDAGADRIAVGRRQVDDEDACGVVEGGQVNRTQILRQPAEHRHLLPVDAHEVLLPHPVPGGERPAGRARPAGRPQVTPGASPAARVSRSVSKLTTPESPSEQSRYRSPTRLSRIEKSGSGSSTMSLSTLMSTDRWGWCSASSGVRR